MKNNIWTNVRLLLYFSIIIAVCICAVNQIYLKCHFVEYFGITCPACGATRATLAILRGDILEAIEYNTFYSVVIFPFFVIFVLEDIFVIVTRKCLKKQNISLVEVLFGGEL